MEEEERKDDEEVRDVAREKGVGWGVAAALPQKGKIPQAHSGTF